MVSACSKNESAVKRIRFNKAILKPIGYFVLANVAFCIGSFVLLELSLDTLFRFFAIQLFFVYIPGVALSAWLFKQMNPMLRVGISYAFGYVINIIEYYIAYGLFGGAATLVALVVALLAMGALLVAPKTNDRSFARQDAIIVTVFVLYVVICMIAYSSVGSIAHVLDSGISINRDMQFWISNAVGCKLGFPPAATYMSGENLYYHCFSSMQIAFLSASSDLSVFDLAVPLFPFGKSIMLVGGIAFLVDCFAPKKGQSYYWFFLPLMLFTTGLEDRSIVTYTHHILLNPFGFDIGIALGCFFLGMMVKQWGQSSFDARLFASALLLWGGLVGTKGPIAMILLVSIALFCIYWLIKKQWCPSLLYGLSTLVLFLVVSIYVAGAFSYVSPDSGSPGVSIRYGDQITSGAILPIIGCICELICLAQPVLVVLMCTAFIAFIVLLIKRGIAQNDMLLAMNMFITAIVGFVLGVVLDVGGRSEMYFTMTAFIPCMCFILSVLQSFFDICGERSLQLASRCLNTIFFVLLIIGMYLFFFVGFMGSPVVNALKDGYVHIVDRDSVSDMSFMSDEAKAAQWIQENTPKDSIILSNRGAMNGEDKIYYYGIFSERQQYMETDDLLMYARNHAAEGTSVEEAARRHELVKAGLSNNDSALMALHDEGVDYLVYDDRLVSELFSPNEKNLELEFESGSIHVYRFV